VTVKPRTILRPRPGVTAEQAREARLRALGYLFRKRIEREKQAAGAPGGEDTLSKLDERKGAFSGPSP
jgi:hypothetical protein